MKNILVYVEAAEGKAKNVGLEILTPAKVAADGGERGLCRGGSAHPFAGTARGLSHTVLYGGYQNGGVPRADGADDGAGVAVAKGLCAPSAHQRLRGRI